MEPTTALVLQLMGLITLTSIWCYFRALNEVRHFRTSRLVVARRETALKGESVALIVNGADLAALPGAGEALARPPQGLRAVLADMRRRHTDLRYGMPLGWITDGQQAGVVCVDLLGDVYHTLITAQSRAGKDNLASTILLTLAHQQPPERLQCCIIDGKGLDFVLWEGKAHTWRLALEPKEIKPAMEALTAERERRGKRLRAAQVSKWESYQGHDLPLLVIYVSELSLLEDAVGKTDLTAWLNSELAAGAAFGMRYIIATQTASNFATRWRSQIGLYLAGFQPDSSQDQPNTGLGTKTMEELGGIPPSKLPAPPAGVGVFTAVQGKTLYTLKASYLSDEQRRQWLETLPDQERSSARTDPAPGYSDRQSPETLLLISPHEQPEPAAVTEAGAPEQHEQGAVERVSIEIPPDERRAILELARAGLSRRKIAQQLYGGFGKYDRVRAVLDEAANSESIAPAT